MGQQRESEKVERRIEVWKGFAVPKRKSYPLCSCRYTHSRKKKVYRRICILQQTSDRWLCVEQLSMDNYHRSVAALLLCSTNVFSIVLLSCILNVSTFTESILKIRMCEAPNRKSREEPFTVLLGYFFVPLQCSLP